MRETCSVHLSVELPREIAQQAEEVQRSDPDFLSRVVMYGLTRRSIYRHLRARADLVDAQAPGGLSRVAS